MKKICFVFIIAFSLSSCSLFRSNKSGCPTTGRNVGAEKLAAGDPAAMKAAKKAPKFKY